MKALGWLIVVVGGSWLADHILSGNWMAIGFGGR